MLPAWLRTALLGRAMTDPAAPTIPPPGHVLTISLFHAGPVELGSLSASLTALADQHARFAEREGFSINGEGVRLYVKEIRSGSIIVELVAAAQTYGPLIGTANTIASFAKNLKGLLDFGTSKTAAPPERTTARDARDMASFLEPVAHNAQSILNIDITNSPGATVSPIIVVSSLEANASQNRLLNFAAQQTAPVSSRRSGVILYFSHATDDADGTTGDKGRIDALSKRSVKTRFLSPDLKASVLTEALFRKAYLVDVDVQEIEGKPFLYTVLEVHESFDRED